MSSWTGCTSTSDANAWNRCTNMSFETAPARLSEALGLAEHVAPPPDGLDVVSPARCRRKLLAQLAHEHVDDLQLGLVHAGIQVAQEHVFRDPHPLPER